MKFVIAPPCLICQSVRNLDVDAAGRVIDSGIGAGLCVANAKYLRDHTAAQRKL